MEYDAMKLDAIWKEMELCKEDGSEDEKQNTDIEDLTRCKECQGEKLCNNGMDIICSDCGLIQKTILCDTAPFPQASSEPVQRKICNTANKRIKKMQEWYMWTNDEKNSYKLTTYTKELCSKLGILESYFPAITSTVLNVMDVIKRHDVPKRAKVKDGIILVCIQYESQGTQTVYSAISLAKKLDISIKYVTKAEKIIIELISNKKLDLRKEQVLEIKTPFQQVKAVINKNQLKVPENVLLELQKLLQICEENDILVDHTPLSIGACCFFFTLQRYQVECDIKAFSKMHNLSLVTVLKTLRKLECAKKYLD